MTKYDALPPDTDWRQTFKVGDVRPSPPDARDFPALARNETPVTLPASFQLPERPIRNQGGKGACVAFSFARIMERQIAGADLSEDEFYARCRTPYDWLCQDTGSFPRDAAAISVSEGWLTEAQRPYNDRDLCTGPDPNRITLGAANRGVEYRNARSWADAQQLIYQFGVGVTICLTVYDSFFSTGPDGIMPPPSGKAAGGHCMVLEGWDDRFAWVPNSWSAGFGFHGYLKIPLRYVDGSVPPEQGGIWTGDLWTVLAKQPEPVPPEPEPRPDLAEAVTILRRREAEQFALEEQYYAVNDPYRGDACWWAAIQLGEAAGEVESLMRGGAPPTPQVPRGAP